MGKRILITSTDLMMIQFLVPHVQNLAEHGYEVEIACSEVGGRMKEVREKLKSHTKAIHTVRLVRSPASLTNLKGYRDMKKVINTGKYDIIWTNEPVMGVVTRLAARTARKNGTKVLYMVHGFHFYKGAPAVNWMVYYPVERWASRFCDEIVTINKEDYGRAKGFHAGGVRYIHGIGADMSRLHPAEKRCSIRKELGLSDDSFLVLSVGELLPRKNQQVIIRALGKLKDRNIHYILCGKGKKKAELTALAKKNGVEDQVHFLGYRKDVADIYGQTDLLALPSRREGLGLAGLEGMYCGLPLVTSNINGIRDYMENGKTGFMYSPNDADGFARGIKKMKNSPKLRHECGSYNRKVVIPFCIENSKREVLKLIGEL
ncbi:MAG TPA: glycosyltransferase family 4 protein [Candidatus Mediterraneibacter tabaqchaliae]|uniref:Glycosyltransferase family 4 protein n=1 Tax=Candidatus Mediterraneibacter tabaqchaliae TaxID=2838689 RepID=A0A9D2R4D4_9FIRM|nr:glycosyltransferase family 4 protein [Candidatus Mediterraneibacter tabaqchaliae]